VQIDKNLPLGGFMRVDRSFVVWVLLLLSLPALCLEAGDHAPVLRVQEAKMQFFVDPGPRLALPLVNGAQKVLDGHVRLEILQKDGAISATVEKDISIAPGSQTQTIDWPKGILPSGPLSYLYWYRLRYRIVPQAGNSFAPQEGIVQLGRITPNLPRILISGNKHPRRGANLRLQVRVDDPRTGKALSGVHVEARLKNNGPDEGVSSKPVRTDSQGYAFLSLKIPADAENEPTVEVTAWHGSWRDSESVDLELDDRLRLNLSTDKPIYQPGQVLHMRMLALGSDNHAMADATMKFTVEDDDRNPEFEQEVKTSSFGVAQADWEIPQKASLGPYKITADLGNNNSATASVRISRYELPEFTVHPETDKTYYLPGQQPRAEITANYLFGKPVTRGKVRVVRTEERHWDSKTQKWESEEEDLVQGELDSSGKFTATLDVSSNFESLRDEDYRRYEDVRFAAYVTDLSTNRTEQKRFTVRLSKQTIHIYAFGNAPHPGWPLDWYVTTAYPDGVPASVDVVVSAVKPTADKFPENPPLADQVRLAHVHTNRYGVAHVQAPFPPKEVLLRGYSSSSSSLKLLLQAGDGHGNAGLHSEQVWIPQQPYLEVKPVKRLLRQGESIIADIQSSLPDQKIFVDLIGPGFSDSTQSQQLALRHGHAQVEFPYDPDFRGNLLLVAYNINSEEQVYSQAEVLFPGPQELDLGLRLQKAIYKPGDPALAEFHVRSPDGKPMTTALGVVVYDKAVAERVRSDEEFGSYGFYFSQNGADYAIGGITYHDLLNKKLTGPVPPDLELVAQAMETMATSGGIWLDTGRFLEGDEEYRKSPASVFERAIQTGLAAAQETLRNTYRKTYEFPKSLGQLRKILEHGGINFDELRDPWGMPYRANFFVSGKDDVVEFISNGPDKLPGTNDDFTAYRLGLPYFTSIGAAIDRVSQIYFQRTSKYIRDLTTLKKELQAQGIDLNAVRDPWGHFYDFKFEIDRAGYVIQVKSAGPDGIFSPKEARLSDDVDEWTSSIRYFQRETSAIGKALAEYLHKTNSFPSNQAELRPVLEAAGLSSEALLDPWGRPYHFEFSQSDRYWDRMNVSSYTINGQPQQTTNVTPVVQHLGWIEVMSYGPKNDPADQRFSVASFSEVLTEQSSKDAVAQKVSGRETLSTGGTGAIAGTVTDPMGAVIAHALIKATNSYQGTVYTTESNENGEFLLSNIPPGSYKVEVLSPGFNTCVIGSVLVTSSNLTRVEARLAVGASSETVEVTAAAPLVEATESMVTGRTVRGSSATVHAEQQTFTPRVRKYFPETLVWQPELVTDSSGKAKLKFLMADNITTWKMSVIGSTTDGYLGVAEKELRTFQPFFVDHDPPKVLTQGDEIQLPVVLRNYLDKAQEVDVKLEPAAWFSLLSAPEQRVKVAANQDAVVPFLISAIQSVHDGKERVTAANRQTGDAVERTVSVHPDGEDVTQVAAAVLSGSRAGLDIEIPANAIPGSLEAEIKIYPNLSTHVLDALRGMVLRPSGCGEQITSLAFGSLLALQVLKKAGQEDPHRPGNPNIELAAQARKYLKQGYDQLTALQAGDGGFPYWADGESNISLSAYVLDFLEQASEFMPIDATVLTRAHKYLLTTQQPNGSWLYTYGTSSYEDRNATALIARVLVGSMKSEAGKKEVGATVEKAMKYLEARIAEWNDAYLVGEYALTAAATGQPAYIAKARGRLLQLAHEEGSGMYWNLEANTSPFYGWGTAGRMETTGLALQALSILLQKSPGDAELSRDVNRGLLFLLKNKDRYGIWYSTHATVNVLKAIISALPQVDDKNHSADTAEILINGQHAGNLRLPATTEVSGPVVFNVSSLLQPGRNKIEVVRKDEGSLLQAQVVATHYIRWADSQATNRTAFKAGDTRALRLGVEFDTTETKIGEPVRCSVQAERIGFSGYGMMLAEVGLPPGADVDRASLEQALSGYDLSQYEVLPDRIIFYLWPRAGGTKFNFVFRPRFGMKAMAAPSTVYDYYNPESRAAVAPAHFSVH
jgi:hypothetical protein